MLFPDVKREGHPFEKRVLITTTRFCNLACRYCYEKFKDNSAMPIETAKKCIRDEVKKLEAGSMQSLSVEFFGGEPFINFKLIKEVVDWTRNQDFAPLVSFSVQTNGTVLNAEIKEWLSANADVLTVGLSYDGVGMNDYNRGSASVDVDFFVSLWPQHAVSVLVIPGSVNGLFASVKDFLNRRIPFEVNLADGFAWGTSEVEELDVQLDRCEDFISDYATAVQCGVLPYDPFDFYLNGCRSDHQFCEDKHSCVLYDVDGRDYFCHLFSPAVLGYEKAQFCRKNYQHIKSVSMEPKCALCALKAFCQPCFGWRNLLSGSIEIATERKHQCNAVRRIAYRCAQSFCARMICHLKNGSTFDDRDCVRAKNSLRYVEEYENAAS